NYVLVKEKKGSMTSLKVRVEPTEERYSQGNLGRLAEAVGEEIYAMLNIHVPVDIVEPNSLPRSVGKAKRVVEE
ncbi:MAG TPA: phenylacetate--CoA ligase, partial [Thermoplasmatales archaeon]|nr:phenylacetate--CoA ligase [Thermoplasmatales archaeon]